MEDGTCVERRRDGDEQGVPCRGDVFHTLYEWGKVLRYLETLAYAAVTKRVDLERQLARPGKRRDQQKRSLQVRLWQAFQALPARQREVFALRYVEGWSTAAVAEALGLTVGSVKRHLFRAVRRLRQTLGGEA